MGGEGKAVPRDAAYFRHHKKCFDLALQLGCTPREAECELRKREAARRWATTEEDLRTHERIAAAQPSAVDEERWMMRD